MADITVILSIKSVAFEADALYAASAHTTNLFHAFLYQIIHISVGNFNMKHVSFLCVYAFAAKEHMYFGL